VYASNFFIKPNYLDKFNEVLENLEDLELTDELNKLFTIFKLLGIFFRYISFY